jgi:hypothetical protein
MADRRATTDPQRIRPGLIGLSSPTMRIAPGIAIAIVLASLLAAGCARAPLGPAFRAAAAPSDLRGRVYLYRADPRGSLATVHVALDDRPVGRFRNDQYETLELTPGTHQLRATLRGFGLTAWGWNTHQFLLEPGQTLYIELSVRLTARAAPDSSNLEIAGRTSGAASENVFIVPRPAKDALSALSSTTRLARREKASD